MEKLWNLVTIVKYFGRNCEILAGMGDDHDDHEDHDDKCKVITSQLLEYESLVPTVYHQKITHNTLTIVRRDARMLRSKIDVSEDYWDPKLSFELCQI